MMTDTPWGDPGDEAAFAALVAEYDKREAPGAGARPASNGQHPAGGAVGMTVDQLAERERRRRAARRIVDDEEREDAEPREVPRYPDLAEFLATEDEPYDWLIDDLIERGDRAVITGGEGEGKSTLIRQMCVQAAAGVHPFTGGDLDPLRVTLIDVENSARQTRRALQPLYQLAGDRYDGGRMTPIADPRLQLDLYRDADRRLLHRIVDEHPCDLLAIGPAYKLASGDPTTEEHARVVTSVIDELRAEHGVAVLMEHHPPHKQPGASRRTLRPYGASLWMRWPEFGLGLEAGALLPWRRGRDARAWPAALQRGGEGRWPWVAATEPTAELYHRIVGHTISSGRTFSYREYAEALGASKSAVDRAVKAHPADWDAMQREYNDGR